MVCRVCIALFSGSDREALSDLRGAQRSGLGGTRPKRGFETAEGGSWKAEKAEREVVEDDATSPKEENWLKGDAGRCC